MFDKLEQMSVVSRILIKGLLGTLIVAIVVVLSFGLIWLIIHAWPVAAALGIICFVLYLGLMIDLVSHDG